VSNEKLQDNVINAFEISSLSLLYSYIVPNWLKFVKKVNWLMHPVGMDTTLLKV